MKATIAAVSPEPRYWEQGQTYFVQGAFGDGSEWSLGFKAEDKAKATIATLKDLIGKEEEYEVEQKPERNGRAQWKLKGWPGKPAAQGFGGRAGKEYIPRYRDTEQGTKEERLSIARSVALQQAVLYVNAHQGELFKSGDFLLITNLSDHFYQWLIKELPPITAQGAGMQVGQLSSPSASLPQAQSGDTPPPARSYQKPPCPQCGKAEFVLQEKDAAGQFIPGKFFCWKNEARQKYGCGHKFTDVGELAHAVGAQRGDQIKPKLEVIKEEIEKAKHTKSLPYLKAVEDRVCQRVDEGKISLDQADEIEKLISAAKKVLQSGQNQATFHDQKVQEAQRELLRQQQLEMNPLEETETPF